MFWASFSLQMGQFSDPVATHPRTNEAEVPPLGLFQRKVLSDNLWPPVVPEEGDHYAWFTAPFQLV